MGYNFFDLHKKETRAEKRKENYDDSLHEQLKLASCIVLSIGSTYICKLLHARKD